MAYTPHAAYWPPSTLLTSRLSRPADSGRRLGRYSPSPRKDSNQRGPNWCSSAPTRCTGVADQVQDAVGIPLLHIIDVTADALITAGLSTVGVLGTAFTMEQPRYRDHLARRGLTGLVPPAADRAEVHRIIYEELCLGIIREESREIYRAIIERLATAGAEGVILGCTEIELLISAADSPIPVFPTTRLHAEAAVVASIEGTLRLAHDWSQTRPRAVKSGLSCA